MGDNGNFKNQSAYEHLMNGLSKEYESLRQMGENKLFQFMATPNSAQWTSAIDADLYDLMDTVPAERSQYYVGSNARVTLVYRDLLDTVCEANQKGNPRYRELLEDYNRLEKEIDSMGDKLHADYVECTGENYTAKGFRTWLREADLEDISVPPSIVKLKGKRADLLGMDKKLEEQRQKLNRPYMEAIGALEDPQNTIEIIEKGSAKKIRKPKISLSGSLQSDVTRWRNASDYAKKVLIDSQARITGDIKSTYSSDFQKVWFSFKAKGAAELTQEIADEKYTMELKLKGIETYNINRGDWYRDQFVSPGLRLEDGAIFQKGDFFGEGGSLHLVPASLLVIYKPVIELTINRDVYERKLKSWLDFNSTFAIFGLGFNGGASLEQKLVTSGERTTITFDAQENEEPQIIGITSMKKYL